MNVFLDGNNEVFIELSDIVRNQGYRYFGNSKSDYYQYFSRWILSFGNLEMIQFLKSKIDLSQLCNDYLQFLAYRPDDNVEIVDMVLGELKRDSFVSYTEFASNAANVNNIIFLDTFIIPN